MKNKQSFPTPRFLYHRNSKGEFNYTTIGKNGKAIGGEQHQGFKCMKGLRDNITANALVFGVELVWDSAGKSCVTSAGVTIPLIEVKSGKK